MSDGEAESAAATMTVNVTAVNDPATGTPTISGTAEVGQVLTAETTGIADADGLTSPTYTYQWVRVDADGVSNETNITDENADTYTLDTADAGKKIKVKVSFGDDRGNPETRTSAAYPPSGTIVDPNTAPTASNAMVTTNEDTPHTFTATEFNFADSDPGDTLASVRVVTLPAAGKLELNETQVTMGQSVPAANIGTLVFKPAANGFGSPYTTFTFKVSDGGSRERRGHHDGERDGGERPGDRRAHD